MAAEPQPAAAIGPIPLPLFCRGTGYQILGNPGYALANLAIAKAPNNTIAAGYTYKSTPSGEAHQAATYCGLSGADLSVRVCDGLAARAPLGFPNLGNIETLGLAFSGDDLLVTGTKNGIIDGAIGPSGASNYEATYLGFDTATTPSGASSVIVW
jgi:hypothetical protein